MTDRSAAIPARLDDTVEADSRILEAMQERVEVLVANGRAC